MCVYVWVCVSRSGGAARLLPALPSAAGPARPRGPAARPRCRHPRRRGAARLGSTGRAAGPAGSCAAAAATPLPPSLPRPPSSSGAGLGLAPGSRGREVMIFQWVFVRSESAPPAGLRASLPGLFITSLPGGSAAAPGLLPATRGGGGGPAGGVPEQRRAGRERFLSRLVSPRRARPCGPVVPSAPFCPSRYRRSFLSVALASPARPGLGSLGASAARRGRGSREKGFFF